MKLLIASNNAHKAREIKEILGGRFDVIMTLREAGVELEVVEDADTFMGNARKKALETLDAAPLRFDASLADDSGLMVDALGGAPGVYSARYAGGEGHDDSANNAKLLSDMAGVPCEKRSCRFVSAVVVAFRDGSVIESEGKVEGVLLESPRGENGFGYDPLFYYAPFDKTFAELSADEKNSVSHRKNALYGLGLGEKAPQSGAASPR